MQKYGDIISRIEEIVQISDEKVASLGEQDTQLYNENFVTMLWRDIDIELANEFQKLLDAERTFVIYKKSPNYAGKNLELKAICEERIKASNRQNYNYLKLLEILNNSFSKKVHELSEFRGYFVCREELVDFIALCRKLNVGPYIKLKDLSREDRKKELNSQKQQKREQYDRLNVYLGVPKRYKSVVNPNYFEDSEDSINKMDDNEFNELIYLGIIGKLTTDMVMDLANLLSIEEFNRLLYELGRWKIFSKDEIEEMKVMASAHMEKVSSMDKLIEFLATKDDIYPEGLKEFIPHIGYENYHYMLDELFKMGVIEFDYYLENTKQLLNDGPKK